MKEFFDTVGHHPLATVFLSIVGLIALAIIGDTLIGVAKAITGIWRKKKRDEVQNSKKTVL